MKNPTLERLRIQAKQYHRHHPWELDSAGVYTHHEYQPERLLTWWGDYGFVLNDRRVMVWWVHPRMKYADAISDRAWQEVGPAPNEHVPIMDTEPISRVVGRSRKRTVAHRSKPTPAVWRDYYDRLDQLETGMRDDGIDLNIAPSISVQTLNWCAGVDLCIPMEIRRSEDARQLILLTKNLFKRETTLADAFPGYQFGRADWLKEATDREKDRIRMTSSEQL